MHRLAVVFALAAACGQVPSSLTTSSAALSSDHLDALFAADAAHAADVAQLGPVDGVLHAMRGNAVYLAAGIDIVTGRRDIRAALEAANPDVATTSLAYTLAGGDVSADGNFGFTFGWLQRTTPLGTTYGTYLAIWQRDDGDDFSITGYYTRSTPFPHIPARAGFPLFVGGAGAGGVPHPAGVALQRRSLEQVDLDFSALCGRTNTSVAFPAYANSAAFMAFGRNFVGFMGAEEIASAYSAVTPGETLQWAPVWSAASQSGDLGVTVGNAVDTLTKADGSAVTTYSKYLTLWVRQADGSWRFLADGGAPSPTPAP
jgi:ketosteroid isomerase-like protein